MYTIRNVDTNRFLEVPFANCEDVSNVATWLNDRESHKKWEIVENGTTIYILKSTHCLSKALDSDSGVIDANAII
ncbi:RICIN domain-containing protein [Aquimarina aggregata]|uniref:RICIN domain-containing protein n=1 Tax=Aquimarina aggregata TaxID=1642818 RepID=UPI0024927AD9|nr:RICIN domain-containing protein [Aquimarina aggregata]